MQLGRVRGTAICSIKYAGLEGCKLLVIEPLNRHLESSGMLQIAVDVVQAGIGDLCVLARSREAALSLPDIKFVPVDLSIVGIIDELFVQPDGTYEFSLKTGQVS
ncbi:MAG: EutN/CcmL family microcompartment protein [Anaerolineaceae bacterium]|nr:EutN/CcmL family microcompartment protein [Anaerolineaceae bacterium]